VTDTTSTPVVLSPRGGIPPQIENIGWTLGNACPYRCPHCYSTIVRTASLNMTTAHVDRVVSELASIGVRTVNLGGNEPLYTSGPNAKDTVLPHIIKSLYGAGIVVGLTTAGITMQYMYKHHRDAVELLNDCDISLDSPFPEEHNRNRGAALYPRALDAIRICRELGIDRTIVMCGMNWNLSESHLKALVQAAREQETFIRINFMKPTESQHMDLVPSPADFYAACEYLFRHCDIIEMGEPLGSAISGAKSRGCPCGTKSFRIHSMTADGKLPVSPCVYAHQYKVGDLLTDSLYDIVRTPEFQAFRQRRHDPDSIAECHGCEYVEECRGGCAARAYLWREFTEGGGSIVTDRDPYCLKDFGDSGLTPPANMVMQDKVLVHRDYLCTVIGKPKD